MDIPSPCYVLHEERLIRNLKLLEEVKRRAGVTILLAFKGFALWSAFPLVRKFLDGATASSLYEARLCHEKMKTRPHTYAVAYEDNSFEEIASLSSHISFNSPDQYERFAPKVPEGVSIGLRVNPEWSDVTTALYNPASPTSRLGIGSHTISASLPERVEGLHFHVLCESSSYALEKVLANFEQKFGHLLRTVKWVNMGGGHLITGKDYDVDHLIGLLRAFKSKHNVQVILEPGSAIAWQTGDLHSTVLDVVENGGTKTAICDISFTCHMPDCLEMPYKPGVKGASSHPKEGQYLYDLGGVSCLAGDYIGGYGFDEPLQIGDQLIFEDMMHYTMVKTTMFNGISHPSIGIVRSDGSFRMVRDFGYEDYRDRLS